MERVADMDRGLWFDLTTKVYSHKTFSEIIEEGWRVTKTKIEIDIINEYSELEKPEDLTEYYGTSDEHEVAIIMAVP